MFGVQFAYEHEELSWTAIIVKNVHIMIVSDVAKKLHTVTFVQSLE